MDAHDHRKILDKTNCNLTFGINKQNQSYHIAFYHMVGNITVPKDLRKWQRATLEQIVL